MTELLDAVRARLAAGLPVRRTLPEGGRIHIDRPLPFLCVYRIPLAGAEPGADNLVRTQASHLVASGDPALQADTEALTATAVAALTEASGACLLLEVWIGGEEETPRFRVRTPDENPPTTIAALASALRDMKLPASVSVEVVCGSAPWPPELPPLVDEPEMRCRGCMVVGLEVPPIFRSADGIYPLVLRALTGELTRALQRGFFEFTRVQTAGRPARYQMMGRRRLVRAVRDADRALAEIGRSFDFLLDVSPVNGEAAWKEFCEGGKREAPAFRYRTLVVDPEMVKRRLYALPLERLEDPVLALLLREKRSELDRQLNLLEDRAGPRFLPGSLQLYGGVEDELLAEALAILDGLPTGRSGSRGECLDAEAFAARARAELAEYRRVHPGLASTVEVRDDVSSVMVSHGNVLVPRGLWVAAERVTSLLHHEVGTHVVTGANGQAQPLGVLAAGLAGYEALQEGIALFAEHLAGGLDVDRLRLIAVRVVAVRRMIDGVSFPALVEELEGRGLGARSAFTVALRVFRGGGLTKDAIYLRGLVQLLAHLAGGGSFEPLLVGKVAIDHVPLVEELVWREVLRPAVLRPRWLDGEASARRMERARTGLRPLDLVSTGRNR